jgi:DNA-binding transcriptional LysR family regulator
MLDDDLAYFVGVANAGSMARAAGRLGVTQPALTKAVQRLERRVGAVLMVRTSQGTELTEAGKAFLSRSRIMAREFEDAVDEARELCNGRAGLLRMGTTPAASNFALAALFPRLLDERPGARMHVTSGFSDTLLDAVGRRDLELALLPLPEKVDSSFETLHLLDDTYQLIVNDAHPLAGRASVTVEELGDCRWAGSSKHEFARAQLERAFALHGIPLPHIVVEANNLPTLLMAVSRMPLASLVNTQAVPKESMPKNLVMLPIQSEYTRCPIGIVWRRGYLSSIALRAREILQEAASDF